jgi:hypothetical protein
MNSKDFKYKILGNSVKFYLPRVEGYNEIIKNITSTYRNLSVIEFDGYFDGKFEPVKYNRIEIHTERIDEQEMIDFANEIREKLNQISIAMELNNRLFIISKK